jgi:hypothetical protein
LVRYRNDPGQTLPRERKSSKEYRKMQDVSRGTHCASVEIVPIELFHVEHFNLPVEVSAGATLFHVERMSISLTLP